MNDRLGNALRQLRGGVLPVLDARSERERRERIAGRVLELSRQLSSRRARRRRFGFGLAAAALVGACTLILYLGIGSSTAPPLAPMPTAELRLVSGHASMRSAAGLALLAHGQLELPSGALLVTPPDETAELRLSSETDVSVAPASEVGVTRRQPTIDGYEERVRLRAGSVALRVPKLGSQGKVSVETLDALVEVHGTRFSVRVVERPPLEAFTEVQVREGRVLVRTGEQSRFLGAGDSWSSKNEGARSDRPAPSPAVEISPPESAAAQDSVLDEPPRPVAARRTQAAPQSAVAASELAQQNRLLEAAKLASKSGMPELALARLEALIERYPDAELAHNARVERFRVLRLAGRDAEAVVAARQYLARYPDGFARKEAEQSIRELAAVPQ